MLIYINGYGSKSFITVFDLIRWSSNRPLALQYLNDLSKSGAS